MLLNTVQLSIRSICGTNFLRSINVRPKIKCRYSKWVSRNPIAIVNEHELFDDATNDTETHKTRKAFKTREKKPKIRQRGKGKEKEKNENKMRTVTPEKGYESLKADDKIISSLMINVKTRKNREKNNIMLLEGFRLIKDALQAGTQPKVIFFNRSSEIASLSLSKKVKLYKVPYRTIQLWSNLTTSPGVIGIFEIPDIAVKQSADDAIPLTIICDNVRDPGNLGTIVRAAAAVGCEKLLLMKGCTDLWDPKVLRSAVGAHFRIPIHTSVLWEEISMFISNESMIFLADNNIAYENKVTDTTDTVNPELNVSTSVEAENDDMKQDDNDANDDQIVENDDKPIEDTIDELVHQTKSYKPMNDDMKQDDYDANDDQILENDEKPIEDTIDELVDQTKSYKPTAKTKSMVKKLISQLPVESYHTLNFTKKEIVLVIGGETEGVSLESCKLLRARDCIRINIPLTNGVDSLNVGVAVGIVTFEMKRQIMAKSINDK